jgi:hypothetical protein
MFSVLTAGLSALRVCGGTGVVNMGRFDMSYRTARSAGSCLKRRTTGVANMGRSFSISMMTDMLILVVLECLLTYHNVQMLYMPQKNQNF